MNCNNCGRPLDANSKFCDSCGTPRPQIPQQPVNQGFQQPGYVQPQPYQQPYQQPQGGGYGGGYGGYGAPPKKSNALIFIIIGILIIGGAAGLYFFTDIFAGGPDKAVKGVFQAIYDEDADKFMEYFGGKSSFRDLEKALPEGTKLADYIEGMLAELNDELIDEYGKNWIKDLKVTVEEKDGDKAEVRVVLDGVLDEIIDVVKVDGKWQFEPGEIFGSSVSTGSSTTSGPGGGISLPGGTSTNLASVGLTPESAVMAVLQGIYNNDIDLHLAGLGGMDALKEYVEYWYYYEGGPSIEELVAEELDYIIENLTWANQSLSSEYGANWISKVSVKVISVTGDTARVMLSLEGEDDEEVEVFRKNGKWVVDIFDFY